MPSRLNTYQVQGLFLAMAKGGTRQLENALDSGLLDVNGCSKRGFQPLLVAACLGQIPAMELLIAKGADVDQPFCADSLEPALNCSKFAHSDGERPLHGAARYINVDAVLLLLRAGADVNAADTDGLTSLSIACIGAASFDASNVLFDIVDALLGAGANPRLVSTKRGASPLHYAANFGNVGAIDLLLSTAPDAIERRDRQGWTALGVAVVAGQLVAVTRLLRAGASIQRSAPGCTLCLSITGTQEEIVRAIAEKVAGAADMSLAHAALPVAAFIGHARILQHVLEVGGGSMKMRWARSCFFAERTPLLHLAVGYGAPSAVRVLLAAGADEAQTDANGKSARDVVGSMDCEKYANEITQKLGGQKAIHPSDILIRRCFDRASKASAAIHCLLEQGPAFRSHSWGWPAGGLATLQYTDHGGVQPTSSRIVIPVMPSVKIFRPKRTASLAGTIGR